MITCCRPRLGVLLLSEDVLVSAQAARRLSSVPKKSRLARKYSVPPLARSKRPPGGVVAGWSEPQMPPASGVGMVWPTLIVATALVMSAPAVALTRADFDMA